MSGATIAEWVEIRDGGRLLFDPDFLGVDDATTTFRWLQTNIAWKQETIFGRLAPRLNAWYAELGINYRYSGITHYGEGWLPELQAINNRVGDMAGAVFNISILSRRTPKDVARF